MVLTSAGVENGFRRKNSPAEVASRITESSAVARIICVSGLTRNTFSAALRANVRIFSSKAALALASADWLLRL